MLSRAERLLTLPPLSAIFALAVPTTAVMVLGAVSGVVNTYFVSCLGADAIAAVSLVFPVNLILMTMMGGGVGAGISAAVAHALGGGRARDAEQVAEHAFVLTAALSVLLTLLLVGGAPVVFRWMGGAGAVLDGAVVFARVLFGGVVVSFAVSTFDSILRGEGNVRVPSLCATVSLFLQILLVPLFMFPFGLGLAGAAAATITGQLVGSLPRAHFVLRGRGIVRPRLFPRPLRAGPIRDILRIGVPASLATLANYFGLLLLTAIVARYGTPEIAAFGLGTRLDFLILTLAFGVGSAVLTLVGLAAGAGDLRRVGSLVSRAVALVAVMLSLLSTLLIWKPAIWLAIFTREPTILAIGGTYLRVLAPSYPFLGVSMACSFTFQGLGRAVFPLVLVTARTAIVVTAATCLAALGAPAWSIFLVMAAGNVASSVVLYGRLRALLRGG
ncbi:MAG TPA: MATE family efflux transporter [Candidatus Binatia bacterium]|nr:MATE family efflux transporter [Candidatus Binatia bacterium]